MAKTEALTTLYGQDRRYAAAQLDTFEGFVVIGRRRGEDRTIMTNLPADQAKELLAGVSIDVKSPHAAVSDRDPARDPRLMNDDTFVSDKENAAAKDAARDAGANLDGRATDAAAKDAPERVAQLNAGYKTDGARIDNPTNEFDATYSEELREGKNADKALKAAKAKADKVAKQLQDKAEKARAGDDAAAKAATSAAAAEAQRVAADGATATAKAIEDSKAAKSK